jgi:hypothetical protein
MPVKNSECDTGNRTRACLGLLAMLAVSGAPAEAPPLLNQDPHRNALGFFDMHLCNWPDRPYFLKMLFSTEQFDRVADMVVFDPRGAPLVTLDKDKFMLLERKGRPPKRVFLMDVDIPEDASTGWYRIEVTDTAGKVHEARDLVPMTRIQRAGGMQPVDGAEAVPMPVHLRWDKVPGARFYQVFVRDAWDRKLVYRSRLSAANTLEIPPGKLQPGGYYNWVVHARDLNEHVLLGDFHNGSMSVKAHFSVLE